MQSFEPFLRSTEILDWSQLAVREKGRERPVGKSDRLGSLGCYRIDPRSKKPSVDAPFCLPIERLAFRLHLSGERALPEILVNPLPAAVNSLGGHSTGDAMVANLPDGNCTTL
jgi:hypothetical protein